MRPLALRVLLSVPVVIVLGLAGEARAGNRPWAFGIGIGYGYGGGPYWGVAPFYYPGFYGNGLSMYGPPVPTGAPIPGVFGGGDSRFFDPIPPAYPYPGWVGGGWIPLSHPAPLPAEVVEVPGTPATVAPPPVAALAQPVPLAVEVHVPRPDARLYIDGTEAKGSGLVRKFATPPLSTTAAITYELRAEWAVDGRTTTHTKQATGRAGENVVVEFK
jgi:uncharacterized protein (TIGR03000 family)